MNLVSVPNSLSKDFHKEEVNLGPYLIHLPGNFMEPDNLVLLQHGQHRYKIGHTNLDKVYRFHQPIDYNPHEIHLTYRKG